MSKSLSISIDNKRYDVTGEDEDLIKKSAKLLNDKIQEIVSDKPNMEHLPSLTKTTLAALNIADKVITNELDYSNSIKNITAEINKIAEYLNSNNDNPNY